MPRCTVTPRLSGEVDGVVLAGEDRLAEVLADLLDVDVEGCGELDVTDVIATEVDVHQTRYLLVGIRVLVVLDALHERAGAVAGADDRHADLVALVAPGRAVAIARAVFDAHFEEFPLSKVGSRSGLCVASVHYT
jgi:hypothetical protein